MIRTTLLSLTLACLPLVNGCSKDDNPGGGNGTGDKEKKEREVKELLGKVHSVKVMDAFDEEGCFAYELGEGENAPNASIRRSVRADSKEGSGAFSIKYTFTGKSSSPVPEYVYFQHRWGDYRSDLSFHPLGVSVWIKGSPDNRASLRFMLIQDENMTGLPSNRQFFAYTDDEILSSGEWTRLVIPYEWFTPYKGVTSDGKLRLDRVLGYRIEVVNGAGGAASGEFLMDHLEQLTSYKPSYGTSQFSSLFIQLTSAYWGADWDAAFRDCLDAGIDTWIVQYSHGFGSQNNVCWYEGTAAPWNTQSYDIIDRMVAAAERCGFKLVFGLFGGDYSKTDTEEPMQYADLLEKNSLVIDELYEKFGASECFAGWYITEEFHDGTYPVGWHSEKARTLLSEYLQGVAAHAKSKEIKYPVTVAPALFRGLPADLCGEWFRDLFAGTPDLDILYLQDCGGRCYVDFAVDLTNYFAHIKRACDETGVRFGVDIESFMSCWCPDISYRAKTWEEVEEQLYVAGLFTDLITNFSWVTFKPGLPVWDDYRSYLEKNGLIK